MPVLIRHLAPRWRPLVFAAAAAAIVLYAALLRADALVGRYGTMPRPAWTRVLDGAAAIGRHLRPATVHWQRVPVPYVGGDPINYLKYAREMESFYQAHVREPVFLVLTRAWLWLFGNADVGLSAASACASTLLVLATILLGRAYASGGVGLAAGLLLAIELDAIRWGVDGWRDDTFALMVTLTGWRLLRLRQQPSLLNGALAGVAGGFTCLTRLTALTPVVPGLAWAAVDRAGSEWRRSTRAAALATILVGVIVTPFLVNCARSYGDPLYAVNYYTRYYRAAEGMDEDASVGALGYIRQKLVARPLATFDTAAGGLFTFPLLNKFGTYRQWIPGLPTLLLSATIAGLLLALTTADGRLLLVVLFSSVAPYMFTWTVGGGSEWRFTEHAYPIYLVLACDLVRRAARLGRQVGADRQAAWRTVAPWKWHLVALPVAILCVAGAYVVLPLLVAREALQSGNAITLAAGPRDWIFFPGAWSAPDGGGRVQLRAALAPHVRVRVVLPRRQPLLLTVRADPAETADPTTQPVVTAFLDRQPLGTLALSRTPGRVGTTRFTVPAARATGSVADIELLASHMVPAGAAGPHFDFIAPATPVAFRLWYVRIEPLETTGH